MTTDLPPPPALSALPMLAFDPYPPDAYRCLDAGAVWRYRDTELVLQDIKDTPARHRRFRDDLLELALLDGPSPEDWAECQFVGMRKENG